MVGVPARGPARWFSMRTTSRPATLYAPSPIRPRPIRLRPHAANCLRVRRRIGGGSERQPDVPVDVLVEQVAERARSPGVAGLGAERAEPHEVTGLDLDPVLVEQVDRLAL